MDKRYLTGTHTLCTKQVPDLLAVCSSGNNLLQKKVTEVLDCGYKCITRRPDSIYILSKEIVDGAIVKKSPDGELVFLDEDGSNRESLIEVQKRKREGNPYSIEYDDDYWEILQGYQLAHAREAIHLKSESNARPGKYTENLHLYVWHGDKIRLQDKIPSRLIPGWNGPKGRELTFVEISNPDLKIGFLLKRTFWGRRLLALTSDKGTEGFAKRLIVKLKAFLEGKPHPGWSKPTIDLVYEDKSLRKPRSRSIRLLEVLKTVNGMFLQRYLAFPNEHWSWEKFDDFALKYLSILLDDEFLDGKLRPICLGIKTRYAELKELRKTYKRYALGNNEAYVFSDEFQNSVPHWLRTYLKIFRESLKVKDEVRACSVRATLSQTRGMGTPPPLVVYQSKAKFINTISTERPKPSAEDIVLINRTMGTVVNMVPDHVFTGLDTKARIGILATACWEKTRQEGGTLEAIGDLMVEGKYGRRAKIISLFTGQVLELKFLEDCSAGEYVFYRCLEEVLESDPKEMSKVFTTVVKEPAKARTVTKGRAALKIVLDAINKIVSYPLKKIRSSKSGMSMDAHGWNFFSEMFTEENIQETFVLSSPQTEEKVSPKTSIIERDYEDLYVECTDYTNATDFMHHDVAWPLARHWMKRCGIPPVLQKIVKETCFSPRDVYFKGESIFSNLGVSLDDDPGIRKITLKTGILMGDPLTKVILHLVNICSRELGSYIASGSYKELIADNKVRTLGHELSTLHLPYISLTEENPEDFRPLRTELGDVVPRPYPPRVYPVPPVIPKVSDIVIKEINRVRFNDLSETEIGKISLFDYPGVLLAYTCKTNGISIGYIPKGCRDPALLGLKSVQIRPSGFFAKCKKPLGDDPDDIHCERSGYKPLNPYRRKVISSHQDRLELIGDHQRYLKTGRFRPSDAAEHEVKSSIREDLPKGDSEDIFTWLSKIIPF
jgi:hypothetical protein